MKFKILWIFAMILLALPLCSAVTIQQLPVTQSNGIIIETPIFDVLQLEKNNTFSWKVYNLSNGLILSNSSVSCDFKVYNKEGTLFQKQNVFDSITLNSTFFNKVGSYSRFIQCNSSMYGDFNELSFKVITNESETTPGDLGLIITIMFFIGFMIFWAYKLEQDHVVLKFGLIVFIFITLQLLPSVIIKTTDLSSALTFYQIWMYLYRSVIIYVFIYMFYAAGRTILEKKGWIKSLKRN